MKISLIEGYVPPDADIGGRPGITPEQAAALEHGHKLRRAGSSRMDAAKAIHSEYFKGKKARFEDGSPARGQLNYLSALLA